ncbi:efflux RND transporter permease subunit, partial [Alphaproteobacteria bacterium]|nr:efflux RND transporter permease subunit [Alphaproteobacteria bacterium]
MPDIIKAIKIIMIVAIIEQENLSGRRMMLSTRRTYAPVGPFMSLISKFPAETREPTVQEVNISEFPILNVVLYGSAPDRVMYTIARRLRDDLESVPSILKAEVSGARQDLLEIIIDPLKLEMYDLSYSELYTTLTNNNRLIAAGSIDNGNGRFSVKIPGIFETAKDVYDIPLKASGNSLVT